jgi:DNA-binding NarL/FixJ family response regulator
MLRRTEAVHQRGGDHAVRVLLADDHPVFLEGLWRLCKSGGLSVVATADNGDDAVDLARRVRPDVAVLNIAMPRLNGYGAAREVRRVSSGTKVILLTGFADDGALAAAWRAGACGLIMKSQPPDQMIEAIRAVAKGSIYVASPAQPVIDRRRQVPEGATLTPRERQILQLVAIGKSSKEIAAVLARSVKTVEHHRERMKKKLGVSRTASLVQYAIRSGLLS